MTNHLIDIRCNGVTENVGITATDVAAQRLFFSQEKSRKNIVAGKSAIAPRSWHHVALVRESNRVTVYLDGNSEPEINIEVHFPAECAVSNRLPLVANRTISLTSRGRLTRSRFMTDHCRLARSPSMSTRLEDRLSQITEVAVMSA